MEVQSHLEMVAFVRERPCDQLDGYSIYFHLF